MPLPNRQDVHVDRPLTNISIAYIQNPEIAYAADKVFPIVPVDKASDKYFVYDRSYWQRVEAQKRAPGDESAGIGFALSTDNYAADVWALHQDVAWQVRDNADQPLDMNRDATILLTNQMLLRREKQFVTNFFAASTWTGSSTGADITVGTQWQDASSTPVEDVKKEITSVHKKTGYRPNVLVLGPDVHNAITTHPDILDRIKYTQRAVVNLDPTDLALLAQVFGVERVVVPFAVENTAGEGAAQSNSFMYGKHAAVLYAPRTAGIMMPSAGYIFTWRGLEEVGNAYGTAITVIPMPWRKADRVEAEMAFAMKVVAADLGAFLASVVA